MSGTRRKRYFGLSPLAWALVLGGVAVFAAANAHLIYVAFESQTECVPHLKEKAASDGAFRAAKPSC